MKKLLLLDNYDSFTFNLLHLIEKVSDFKVDVYKNDRIDIKSVDRYDKIVLSPGPGLPSTAGIMPALIQNYASSKSILGVCLGMQAIAESFACRLKNLDTVFHGLATPIHIVQKNQLFKNCPSTFQVGRYHSWVIDEKNIGPDIEVTALDNNNLIMAIQHKQFDLRGVQFHPESILSEYGETILKNWLST